jgi:hypothetical protein
MRTTLDLADDVLAASRAIARARGKSMGEVVSELAREALRKPASGETRAGVPLLPRRAPVGAVTLDLVNDLRDEIP